MFIVSTLRSYGAQTKILRYRNYKDLVPTGRRPLTVSTGRRPLTVSTGRRPLTVPTGRRLFTLPTGRRLFTAIVGMTIVLSFVATLVPVASASLTKSSTMACCVGKDHCDSGIAAKKIPPPKSETMCGLHGAEMEDDGITIVAPPVAESHHSHSHAAETNSSQPAAGSASLSRACHMDCSSCATAIREQKRDRNTFQTITFHHAPLTTLSFDEDQPLLFSSNGYWEHMIPRGPPSALR